MPALTLKVFLRDLAAHGWNRRDNADLPYRTGEELTRGAARIRVVPYPNAPIGIYAFEYRAPGVLQRLAIQATAKPWLNRYSDARMPSQIDVYLPAPRWSPPERNLHLWIVENYFQKHL